MDCGDMSPLFLDKLFGRTQSQNHEAKRAHHQRFTPSKSGDILSAIFMKLTSLIALVLPIIFLMTEYVLNYWYGYYEESLSPISRSMMLELTEFILLLVLLLPALLIAWIISLFRKKHRLWTTAMLAGLLALIGFQLIVLHPSKLIIYGMRNRMMRDYSLDDLRRFARDIDQLPRPPNDHYGSTKGFTMEDLDKTELKVKYPFLSWGKGPGFEGPSFITESDGLVNVRWGGALAGHWGFSVVVNGGKANPSLLDAKILRVSDDIFFITENY